ncbi:hypothetical protein P7K49_035325 [Saguinus oedipus]|uniref:NmrA-like domain-containing protein n=1 Tax=Saguinus oedipus TaxID=9490 RepID=A0ABQ9TN05_SAGOE|nr:hypothetical protein P7K49_035325 [Saguinus oedipus]
MFSAWATPGSSAGFLALSLRNPLLPAGLEDAAPGEARAVRGPRRDGAMDRRPRLPGLEADLQPQPPPEAPPGRRLGRKRLPGSGGVAWAWRAWRGRGGVRAVKGARRAGCGDSGGPDGGGCCARYCGRCLRRRRRGLSPPRAWARCGLVMVTAERPFHLVVFGASGFTGQFVTEEVAREQVDPERSSRLPWAVAGRSREKLQRVLERAALKLGKGAAWDGAVAGTPPRPNQRDSRWGAPCASEDRKRRGGKTIKS